ncbi:hypothetical protein ACFE04_021345 [Oxalis oulophora]
MLSQSDHHDINMQTKPKEDVNKPKTRPPLEPPQGIIKCPRCDSPNTKFCYYNNYSLTQPRHFCKTCRRYWTKGGALRNVPIGGGCRKNKKIKSSSSSNDDMIGGFKFFHGISQPAMDFNLGGLSSSSSPSPTFSRFNNNQSSSLYNQFSSFDPSGSSSSSTPLLGFNPLIQEMGSLNVNSSLANSIESLSSINQDLHWKLQQQRLAALFGNGDTTQKEQQQQLSLENNQTQNKPQPILFQNLEISKQQPVTTTEWFFGNSNYAPLSTSDYPSQNGGGSATGNDNTTNDWNGSVQTWSTNDLHQYSALP